MPDERQGSGEAAFVIQLAGGADDDGGSLHGWVEHLASGIESNFRSADELLAFMRRLASPAGGAGGSRRDDGSG